MRVFLVKLLLSYIGLSVELMKMGNSRGEWIEVYFYKATTESMYPVDEAGRCWGGGVF